MNGASKILTVSYGTFSCTLEGFDDPFNTMKAIAEYFRDLAAEDRYFGAEPPQPDAAMLHKIAEREIQRRVEAKIQENGVILRAESDAAANRPVPSAQLAAAPAPAAQTPVAPPVVQAEAPAPVVDEAPAPRITMPAAEPSRPAPAPAPTVADPSVVTSSVAEKLLRLRQAAAASAPVAATAATLSVMPKAASDDDFFTEDQHAETVTTSMPFPEVEDVLPEDAPAMASADFEDSLPEDTAEDLSADSAYDDDGMVEVVSAPVADEAMVEEMPAPVADETAVAPQVEEVVAEEPMAEVADLAAADVADSVAEPEVAAAAEVTLDAAVEPVAEPAIEALVETPAQDDDSLIASLGELLDTTAEPAPALVAEAKPEIASAAEDLTDLDSIKAALASYDDKAAVAPAIPDLVDLEEADDITGEPVSDTTDDLAEAEDVAVADAIDTPEVADADIAPADDDVVSDDSAAWDAAEDETPVTATTPADEADAYLAESLEAESDEAAEADAAEAAGEAQPSEDNPEAPITTIAAAAATAATVARAPDMEDVMARITQPVRPVRPVRPARPGASDERPAPLPLTDTPPAAVAPAAPTAAEPITIEKLQRARARVIRVRRNDDAEDAASSAPADTALSAEAEAALEAELAAVRDDTTKSETPNRLPPTGDEAVTRLIAEASTQMEVPDARRRLSAIAHLKAAVAATLADRKSSDNRSKSAEAERMTAYREDLAQVARPASPPASDRPAPLVLVSEQRIDRPRSPAPAPGMGPTLVTRATTQSAAVLQNDDFEDEDEAHFEADTANIFDGATSFRDFAERLGAQELPDMLEAAAAYIACVEGRESFTRPQLMQHLSSVATDVAREDSLRSFGILLREGRIEKSRRGQFSLNAGSHILAEAKKFAG